MLTACRFGAEVRRLAAPYYDMDGSKGGQPGIDPEVYFKMRLVGFFENLPSERAIAARCADSLSIREFLHYGLGERTPHHSSCTVIRQRLAAAVYEAVFGLLLRALKQQKLLKGRHLAIDTSVMEANASLRSLEHRLTGAQYRQYVKRLAALSEWGGESGAGDRQGGQPVYPGDGDRDCVGVGAVSARVRRAGGMRRALGRGVAGSGGLGLWRWPGGCWWSCGGISRRAWCRRARCSRRSRCGATRRGDAGIEWPVAAAGFAERTDR